MFSIEEFSRVVSQIYASSISPQKWAVALTDISRMLDATGSAIYIVGEQATPFVGSFERNRSG
jgi:hypothetical protein